MDIIGDQRTTEDFMRAAVERGIRRWDIHTCGGCGYPCGFIIDGEAVLYDSGCDCGGVGPLQPRSWSDLADHYNRNQPSRNPRADGKPFLADWLSSLPGPEKKLLAALADHWPDSYSREELAEVTGYEATGGAFKNPLGRLRTLELVNRGPDVRLTDDFGEAIQ